MSANALAAQSNLLHAVTRAKSSHTTINPSAIPNNNPINLFTSFKTGIFSITFVTINNILTVKKTITKTITYTIAFNAKEANRADIIG